MRVVAAMAIFFAMSALARPAAPRHRDEIIVDVSLKSRKGALGEDALKKRLEPRRFRGCGSLGAGGEFVVRARIDRSGDVIDAKRASDSDNAPAFRCVLGVVNSTVFPKAGGPTTVDVSVHIARPICDGPGGR